MTRGVSSTPEIAPAAWTTPPARAAFDLLRVPVLGSFLRWRRSRLALQLPVLALSLAMIAHAFWGSQLAPKNLGTLLTWVHFRGLVVLVLLLMGNFFCMACPFMVPRELARRFFSPRWDWPRRWRNKIPAIVLFVGVLFAYELFDLWGDPWWTGALIVGYFAAAVGVDAIFRRAAFCKYVCPVGQFNFLGSTLSPLEVAVREPAVCHDCGTKDCIRGRRADASTTEIPGTGTATSARTLLPVVQRGCELDLFQPRKVGNLDCTFCLDCVYACPHDNIGIVARLPGESLPSGKVRSGIGSLDRRSDWTALMIVFVFGAILNAFAMTSPVYVVEQTIAEWTGLTVEWPILALLFAVGLVVEPIILVGGAAELTRRLAGVRASRWEVVNRFTRSLIPFGFGVWLAHYGFHFFTGVLTVIPVVQNLARSLAGWPLLGNPQWQLGGLPESIVYPLELGFLGLGLLGSLVVGWRIAVEFVPDRAAAAYAPWACVTLLLFASACWILTQPMDMRGTFLGG